MATNNTFYNAMLALVTSSMDFGSDVFKAFLTNTAPNSSGWTKYSSISANDISGINGYTSGGATITMSTSLTTNTESVFWSAASPTWTGTSATSTAGFGPFQYVVLYSSNKSNLLSWFDYGGALTVYPGDTFTLTSTAAGLLFTLKSS